MPKVGLRRVQDGAGPRGISAAEAAAVRHVATIQAIDRNGAGQGTYCDDAAGLVLTNGSGDILQPLKERREKGRREQKRRNGIANERERDPFSARLLWAQRAAKAVRVHLPESSKKMCSEISPTMTPTNEIKAARLLEFEESATEIGA